MNRAQLYAELRELIGNPDANDVTNKQLDSMLVPALEWLAVKLDYSIYTDTRFQIIADKGEYLLPQTFGSMIFVEHNSIRLTPSSIFEWQRDGTDYRNSDSGTPREYAIRNRNLVLFPVPATADVTTDPYLTIQYIGSARPLDAGGAPGLSELDCQLLILRAAVRYCRTHPSEENAFKINGYNEEIAELLPAARDRAQNAIEEYEPSLAVEVDRYRGAR